MLVSIEGHAQAASLEVYGRLPAIEEMSLSPDGSRIAFVRTMDDMRVIQVVSLADRHVLNTVRVGEQKLRSLDWADDDHLMIVTSAAGMPLGLVGAKHEWAMLQIYDVARHRVTPVPHPPREGSLDILNVISGSPMVRRVAGHTVLFVTGYCLDRQVLPALFRVDLKDGRERVMRKGSPATQDWMVNGAGEIIAEQDYDEQKQRWALQIRREGGLEEVAAGQAAIDIPWLLGFGPSTDTLLMRVYEDGIPVWKLVSLSDGKFGARVAQQELLEAPVRDPSSHRLVGAVSVDATGDTRYVFFDPRLETRWADVSRAFEGARVSLTSASDDFRKIVVLVDGPRHGFNYRLVDLDTYKAVLLGQVYAGVTEPFEVRRLVYPASDKLPIPAYLTLPRGRAPRSLPLVVLPHGGPAARDTGGFDWWSQALADQGYAVLQPNYRGSALLAQFLAAGFGEWGRKMQTDLSDGVRYLAGQGIVDPARVCIVGASYGGYAALAGVTLDSGTYRCAVSVAGLSDLKRMLDWVNDKHAGHDNLERRYWDRFMGVSGPGDPALEKISPVEHVDAVNVPVLLIHGREDTVVPFEQSQVMFDALRHAHKDVELVQLRHEDHWLSRSETRLQMLEASVDFLRTHNPPGQASASAH